MVCCPAVHVLPRGLSPSPAPFYGGPELPGGVHTKPLTAHGTGNDAAGPPRPAPAPPAVCTLADMAFDIYHATIDSDKGIATQEYYIR